MVLFENEEITMGQLTQAIDRDKSTVTSLINKLDDVLLQAMPETALIINVGRGNVIHEPALIRALENKDIAGAVLDVFQEEPLPPDHGFWQTPNTIQ